MKIVITGICGLINSGDHAQFHSLLSVLKEAFPKANISAVHRNPNEHSILYPEVNWLEQIGVSYSSNIFNRRTANVIGNTTALINMSLKLRTPQGLRESQCKTYEELISADLVIACPGGYLQDTAPSIIPNLIHLGIANRFGKPLFFAPQSIGPFSKHFFAKRTKNLLNNALAICLRETISMDYTKDVLGISPDKLHLFSDMAFYETNINHDAANEILSELGINQDESFTGTTVMDWWFPGNANPKMALKIYIEEVAKAAKKLYAMHGIRTIFLRQVGDMKGVVGDEAILKKIQPIVGDAGIFSFDYHTPEVLRGIIKQCLFFWGTRMHSNIFAITQGVPPVAISYQHKTRGIMRMCGVEDYVLDIETIDSCNLLSLFDKVIENNVIIRNKLEKVNHAFQLRRDLLVNLIRTSFRENNIYNS